MLVLGLKDKICGLGLEQYGLGLGGCPWPWIQGQHCGLGLVGEKQNFNIVCRLYEFNSHCARLQNNTTLSETKHQLIKKYKIYQ